jgi:hypothetical protein
MKPMAEARRKLQEEETAAGDRAAAQAASPGWRVAGPAWKLQVARRR